MSGGCWPVMTMRLLLERSKGQDTQVMEKPSCDPWKMLGGSGAFEELFI